MRVSQIIFSAILIFITAVSIFAQENKSESVSKSKEQSELEEKAYKLLSKINEETSSLKLPENRILVDGIVGNLLWKQDEKLARQIIRSAVNEFIQLQTLPKYRLQADKANYWFYISNNLRGQMLYSLRQKDAEFALEILYATRSAEINNAVQNYQQIIAEKGVNPNLSDYKQAEQNKIQAAKFEIDTEQTIKREIAKNDPQKLSENIRESFAKDIGIYQILFDLETLNKKDHELAQKLLTEIMAKLGSVDFSKSSEKNTLTFFIYGRFLSEKKKIKPANQTSDDKSKNLEFDEKSVKAIANNEIDYFLKETNIKDDSYFLQKALYLKKVLPERFREIEKKYETSKKNFSGEWIDYLEASQKLGENPSLEQIIENSSKLSLSAISKENYYRNAISKLLETESEEKIAQKLERIADAEDKQKALDYLKSSATKKNAAQKSLPDSISAVNEIKSKDDKTAALINLAIYYHQKKTDESRKIAEDLMNEVRKLIKESPETATEYEAVFPLISGYVQVSPTKAFDLIAPLIRQSNEVIEAYVIYTNYDDRNYPYVSEKEIIFAAQDGYNSYKSKYAEIVRMLAQNDFEQAENLVNNFQREDIRIIAKLILVESILMR